MLLIRRTVRPRGYASGLHSLRPCLRNGASWRAGVGRVRSLNVLTILRNHASVLSYMWGIEAFTGLRSFSLLAIWRSRRNSLTEYFHEVFACEALLYFLGRANSSQTSTLCRSRHSVARGMALVFPVLSVG